MNKKYELTDECINFYGRKLYRIKALVDFSNAKSGDLGGYVESYNNLSQEGTCWIYGDAKVCGSARVYGNAKVCGNAIVYGNAIVDGNAEVGGDATIVSKTDYIVIGPIGSRNCFTTFYKCYDNSIRVICGCFRGSIDEFIDKVSKTHGDSKYAKEYNAACALATIHIE